MLGVVVSPAPSIWSQRREELRLPKRKAARRGEAAGSWAKRPKASQHPGSSVGEAPRQVAMETNCFNHSIGYQVLLPRLRGLVHTY